ncbi:MAG: inorganic phosphate transporter [Bacteroidia bacterium]|nr:inorganic phosphate transporter [Bacteroidia bacterium]
MFGLDTGMSIVLIVALLAACTFEFINGFHDTANAVATVIYTRSLKPTTAVIWSGIWNFMGVFFGGIAVAMSIVNLLPLEALVDQNIYHNIAMIAALILTAIIWNLGTWYLGIPCSSSHTLIGSIFGVGIAFMFITPDGSVALNWQKVIDAGLSLMISPMFGFFLTIFFMMMLARYVTRKSLFRSPTEKRKPPYWVKGLLVLTCTTVSFSHGSNDGQKGVGLVMIILIALLPGYFALDASKITTNMTGNVQYIEKYINKVDSNKLGVLDRANYSTVRKSIIDLKNTLSFSIGPEEIPVKSRFEVRKDILTISRLSEKLLSCKACPDCGCLNLTGKEIKHFKSNIKELKTYTEFAPWWVILMISVSLGIGTMIGWKRIVTTIGEKIGKTNMSYAQGLSAQTVASTTIFASSLLGLPVSTTHVLSSGVAGSMVATRGWKNLHYSTLKSLLVAWVVTIPVTIILACSLFLLFRAVF